jgi:hypothetical protein
MQVMARFWIDKMSRGKALLQPFSCSFASLNLHHFGIARIDDFYVGLAVDGVVS